MEIPFSRNKNKTNKSDKNKTFLQGICTAG